MSLKYQFAYQCMVYDASLCTLWACHTLLNLWQARFARFCILGLRTTRKTCSILRFQTCISYRMSCLSPCGGICTHTSNPMCGEIQLTRAAPSSHWLLRLWQCNFYCAGQDCTTAYKLLRGREECGGLNMHVKQG